MEKQNIFTRIGKFFAPSDAIAESQATKSLNPLSLLPNYQAQEPPSLSTHHQLNEYRGWVYAAVRKTATTAAQQDFTLFEQRNAGVQIVEKSDVLDLLYSVNDELTWYDLTEMTITFLRLTGEAYWLKLRNERGKVIGIWPYLSPQDMTVVPATQSDDSMGTIAGYVYSVPTSGAQVPIDKEDIVYFKEFNPLNMYRGFSPVKAAEYDITTQNEVKTWNYTTLKNGAVPLGVLSNQGTFTDEQFQRLKEQFNNAHQGSTKARNALILEGGAQYQATGWSAIDLDFSNQMQINRDTILSIFGVPKSVLGIVEDVNRANAEVSKAVFLEETINPILKKYADTITEQLIVPDFQENLYIEFTDVVPKNTERELAKYDNAVKNGWMTRNEVRQIEGYAPVEGGDTLYIPVNYMPIGELPAEVKSLSKTKRPETVTEKVEKKVEQVIEKKKKEIKATENKKAVELTKEIKMQIWDLNTKSINRQSTLFTKALRDVLRMQERKVLKSLSQNKKHFKTKATEKDIEQYLLSIDEEVNVMVEFTKDSSIAYAVRHANQTANMYGLADRITDRDVVSYIVSEIKRFARETTETTNKALSKTLLEGIDAGESIMKLRNRVKELFTEISTKRAEMIARTESATYIHYADQKVYEKSGVTIKEWFADPGACEFCQPMDGMKVPVSTNFFNKGDVAFSTTGQQMPMNYRAVNAPPLHPNCTCTLLAVLPDL